MRDRLQENGFSNPDFRFVGVTTWSRSVNVVQSFFDGALRFDMESLQGDDLKSEGKQSRGRWPTISGVFR
jgi:hypothetical protein